jgi:hypothetical protein
MLGIGRAATIAHEEHLAPGLAGIDAPERDLGQLAHDFRAVQDSLFGVQRLLPPGGGLLDQAIVHDCAPLGEK